MMRRVAAELLALSVLAVPLRGAGQPTVKVFRIGFLSGASSLPPASLAAFREALRDLGWIEGRNVAIEFRFAEGQADRLPALAADLVRSQVTVIAAGGGTAAVAAKNATETVPIVMIAAGDPVGLGLVSSLARPGGNVTGVAWDVGLETFAKSLEMLKEIAPQARRVAVLSNPANPGQRLAVKNLGAAAGSLRLQPQFVEAREPSQIDGAFASMTKERAQALFIVADPLFIGQRARLAELATTNRLPSMSGGREYVESGGLVSYGPSLTAAFHRAGFFVDRLLRGAKPADLPVEQPTKFELILNMKAAARLGLTIPQSVFLRADQVIE